MMAEAAAIGAEDAAAATTNITISDGTLWVARHAIVSREVIADP